MPRRGAAYFFWNRFRKRNVAKAILLTGDSVKKIVVPGEKISDAPFMAETTFVEGNKTYASVAGMMDEEN